MELRLSPARKIVFPFSGDFGVVGRKNRKYPAARIVATAASEITVIRIRLFFKMDVLPDASP